MRIYKVGSVETSQAYIATWAGRPYEAEKYAFGHSASEALYNLLYKLGLI